MFIWFAVENIHLTKKVGVAFMTVDDIKCKNNSIKEEDFKDVLAVNWI